MVGGMAVGLLGIFILVFTSSLGLGVLGLVLLTFGLIIPYNLTYIFITEMVEESRRQNYKIVVAAIFSAGGLANVLFFYLVPNFQKVMLFFYGIPILAIIVVFIVFFKDTPISLITKNTPEDAFKHLRDIARMNGIEEPELTVEEVEQFQQNYDKNFVRKTS